MSSSDLELFGFADDDPLAPDVFSNTEFNEILRSMDSDMDPLDPTHLGFDDTFAQSEALSAQTTETISLDNGHTLNPSDPNLGSDDPQGTEFTGKLLSSREDAANVLKEWFDCHSQDPYPTKAEKASLAQESGLSVTQVSTWFANARRRRKQRADVLNGPLTSTSLDFLNSGAKQTASEQSSDSNPLDRWRNSPPEVEAAPLEAIINAVSTSETRGQPEPSLGLAGSALSHSPQHLPFANDAKSLVSSDGSGSALSSSSGSSAYSFDHKGSHSAFGRFYLNEPPRRRRRRGRTKPASVLSKLPTKTARPYQCTFCTDTFRTKHDWTRHEKTLHLSLEKFLCAPLGSTYRDQSDGIERCAFCDDCHPSESHIESHRFTICQQKPTAFRTFYRKDHLQQHLRQTHRVNHFIPSMETWKSQVTHVNSRCGFCSETFLVWSERNDHIAQHFRKGASMKDWRGCRGLDPSVALAVENAMPPYLIGMESAGMEPFSASQLAAKVDATDGQAETADQLPATRYKPTPFEHLTAQLSEYVQKSQASGTIVTDEMLQNEARRITYGDDDPWNQTPADSPEWLKLFKEGMGLGLTADLSGCPSYGRPEGEDFNFCLPWSADHWAPFDPTANSVNPNSSGMTWSWQSPECLVEFRQHIMAVSSAGPDGGPGDAVTEACPSTSNLHTPAQDVGTGSNVAKIPP